MSTLKYLLFTLILIKSSFSFSQDHLHGENIMGSDDFIKYLPGNMPLVISIPHGGYLLPDEIPERPCIICAKNQDIFTLEIGLDIRDAIYQQTGYYPYLIINNLHRTRLDPNRNITEAADGNTNAEGAWIKFQNSIDSANAEVQKQFGKGLYIDLHGHRHNIMRAELGYLLNNEELQMSDEMINYDAFVEYSSIRNLVGDNINSFSYSELVRGKFSLGTMLEDIGYPSVPSQNNPAPKPDEPFFSGGYNTTRHGSSSGGTIDGIQIELDEGLRNDLQRRKILSKDLGIVLVKFLETHYFPDLYFNSAQMSPED